MLRLPRFEYRRPANVAEAARILAAEGPRAMVVAGGTDLWPKMKRRQMTPTVVVGLRHLHEMRGVRGDAGTGVRIGANTTLRELERDPKLLGGYAAVREAARSISSPPLKTMGTIGGNLCVDTRCFYYDQSYEWRKSIDFCMKKDGEICWVAPASPRCWAVSSTDLAPVMLALDARIHLVSPPVERVLTAVEFYNNDGIEFLHKRPEEILTSVELPAVEGAVTVFKKLRRRGAIDFPLLNVAAWLKPGADGRTIEDARIAIGGVTSAPFLVAEAGDILRGGELSDDQIRKAAHAARSKARPLDNTDLDFSWRRAMVEVWVRRALEEARDKLPR